MNTHLCIAGYREFNNYNILKYVTNYCINILRNVYNNVNIISLSSGGCRGTDSLAIQYAHDENINFILYEAEWKLYGKSAGYKRNKAMVNNNNVILIFLSDKSVGSLHDINIVVEHNKNNVNKKILFIYHIESNHLYYTLDNQNFTMFF